MAEFATTPPIPYVEIGTQAAAVRTAIDAARLSAANSFGGLQKLAIPGPFATDAEASTGGVPDDNLYYRSDGTVRAASHISLDLAFALDKTLTARTGPTPTFSRASSGLFVNANGILVGKTAGTTVSLDPTTTTAGTTEVTVNVASGSVVGWLVGQSVSLIVDSNANNAPDTGELWLVGDIVSMTATQLIFKVTSKGTTSASATDWTLGYRGARFDHDPATGASKGLLIEEPRSNVLTYSEDMTVANGWIEDGGTGTVAWENNVTTSPSGVTNAEKLTEASTASVRRIAVKLVSVVNGTSYIISVFAKAAERSILQICTAGGFTPVEMNFDLVNGVLGSGTATNAQMTNFGNGWWRCSMTVVATATTSTATTTFGMVSTATSSRLSSTLGVVGNGLYLWGAQLEVGAFPTSYIPTTIGTAARSADVCSIVGTDFSSFYNQSEGTLFAEHYRGFKQGGIATIGLGGIDSGKIQIFQISGALGTIEATIKSADNSVIFLNTFPPISGLNKTSLGYKLNDAASSCNGSVASTDNNVVMDSTRTALVIGSDFIDRRFGGHIARITYYRKRLSNAKLQTLTTP